MFAIFNSIRSTLAYCLNKGSYVDLGKRKADGKSVLNQFLGDFVGPLIERRMSPRWVVCTDKNRGCWRP